MRSSGERLRIVAGEGRVDRGELHFDVGEVQLDEVAEIVLLQHTQLVEHRHVQ